MGKGEPSAGLRLVRYSLPMTTLVGIQGRNWALLGADTRIAEDGSIYQMVKGSSKILQHDDFTIACAGDMRAINILESGLKIPKSTFIKNDAHFVTAFLIPAIKKAFFDAGYEKTTEGQTSHESEFLIIYHAKIYALGGDYSWIQDARGIYALGAGGQIALGALATLVGDTVNRREARAWALKALDVASKYNSDTAPPFHVVIKD